MLRGVKRHPHPASQVASAFQAQLDAEPCTGCGKCARRCPMDALVIVEKKAVLDTVRCIGCGLCVTTCPSGAMTLRAKADAKAPPKDTGRLYARMYRDRFGTLGFVDVAARRLLGIQS